MTLSNLKFAACALVVAGATATLVVQHQNQARSLADNATLQQQLAQLESDNTALSNQVIEANNSLAKSRQQQNELLKLRGEVGRLQQQAHELDRLRAENQQLKVQPPSTSSEAENSDAENEQKKIIMRRMDDTKQSLVGVIMFADFNQHQCPTNFDQMASFFTDTNILSETAANFDFVYQGAMTDITNNADTIVFREKQSWPTGKNTWAKIYGFADGHVEVHATPDGNFDEFENQHIQLPAQGQ